MQTINDSNYLSELDQKKSVVVFWAEWCGPCKALKPIAEKVAEEMNLSYYTCDIDESYNLTSSLNVMAVPTTMLFDNGKVVGRFVGTMPQPQMKEKFELWQNNRGLQEDS